MEGAKLELSGRPSELPASYKVIPEAEMEEEAVTRPKSLVKSKPASPEVDGADEKMLPNEEKVAVKVSPNEKQNGDAKLDIGELKTAFVGLTKEELMKYANDPFWVRLRWFLFITFWVLWGMMLIGAIMIICAAPKCDPPPPRTWWQKGPLVEIGDDLEAEEMEKLKGEGVSGVIMSWPEDVYIEFDENHDFIKSVKKYKELEINVIVDLEPGNTDMWFNKSENRVEEFGNYYIWKQPKSAGNDEGPEPPNNWLRVNNNSSWIYSPKRKEFYYAPTGKPHLNFRNSNVTEKFSNVLKKFLGYGIGGVRLRGVPFLLMDPTFADEEIDRTAPSNYVLTEYGFYTHTKTENLKDLGPLLKQWNVIVKNNTENGPFMASEDLSKSEAYKVDNLFVFDFPVQSDLFTKSDVSVSHIVHMIESIFDTSNSTWPLWKCNSTEALDIVAYLLPGTPFISEGTSVNKDLLKIRNSPSIMRGIFNFAPINETVFAFIRVAAGNPGILVALNPTENRTIVDFPATFKAISEEVTVLLFSSNYNEPDVPINVKQDAHKIPIPPNSAIVLSYVPPTD